MPLDFHTARIGESIDLINDPRSSRAFLYGCDDGRASLREDFLALTLHTACEDEKDLALLYSQFEIGSYLSTRWMLNAMRSRMTMWLMRLRITLTGSYVRAGK